MSLERVEALLDALEASAAPEVLLSVRELISLLLDTHAAGLRTILAATADVTTESAGRTELMTRLLEDPLVVDLLLLHGLHPEPREDRAQRAVERLRRDLGVVAAELTLRRVDDDAIEVSLPGATMQIAQVVVERLEREVPDAGPVLIAELPTRHLLPVIS